MFGGPPPKPSPAEQAAAKAQVQSNVYGFIFTASVLFALPIIAGQFSKH